MDDATLAHGKPGNISRWTTSSKIGVGTSAAKGSKVWFALSEGILNEVYFPRIDIANLRDMEFLVTDGKDFFSEEKRNTRHEYKMLSDGVPAYLLINTCLEGRYRIEKIVIVDPERNVLLQHVTFTALKGSLSDYHLYVLLAPHIGNSGFGNNGWTGELKGLPMLFAEREGTFLASGCSVPFIGMNCGYVGSSDTWQDLSRNKRMTWFYSRAMDGNIALGAEIDLKASKGSFVIATAFANHAETAGVQVRASLTRNFKYSLQEYVEGWNEVHRQCVDLSPVDQEGGKLYKTSIAVLKTHEGKEFVGSIIASLSIPWGNTRNERDIGNYHLIWPLEQVQSAEAFLASGDSASACKILHYLMSTQEADGHWEQCFWGDGSTYWKGQQLDETALPILLADHLKRLDLLQQIDPWEMVSKAASYLIQNGPVTQLDRWSEESGYTPFTIAAEIAALLAAADFFERRRQTEDASYLRHMADWWNENLERWLYVEESDLSKQMGILGYYVRIKPAVFNEDRIADQHEINIKNRPLGSNLYPYRDIVSVDALALVRFGLRSASDPRILNTVKVIDHLLKVETDRGMIWHRYNQDGYGEHEDGSSFNGVGKGRGWPLLVGERAHYELAKGDRARAMELLRLMTRFSDLGGLLPEQIWDAKEIPERGLYNGHAAGSAKPLVWAHAEYISLLRSLQDGNVFSTPPQTIKRYQVEKRAAEFAFWRFNFKCSQIPQGKKMRVQVQAAGTIHWSVDNWQSSCDLEMKGTGLGVYYADLSVEKLTSGSQVVFTFFWSKSNRWEGVNYEVKII